jgi:hypothetical protein
MKNDLAIFEGHQIRRRYDEKTETWWFSVVDIVRVLTQQPDFKTARKYWNKLKERLDKEGSQLVTNCHQLKMPAADGKNYLTDVATAETLLRLVQSVPSPDQSFFTALLGNEDGELLSVANYHNIVIVSFMERYANNSGCLLPGASGRRGSGCGMAPGIERNERKGLGQLPCANRTIGRFRPRAPASGCRLFARRNLRAQGKTRARAVSHIVLFPRSERGDPGTQFDEGRRDTGL